MNEVMDYLVRMYNGATLQIKADEDKVVRYKWCRNAGLIIKQISRQSIGCTSWYNAQDSLDDFFLMLHTEEIKVIGGPIKEPPKPVSHIRKVEL